MSVRIYKDVLHFTLIGDYFKTQWLESENAVVTSTLVSFFILMITFKYWAVTKYKINNHFYNNLENITLIVSRILNDSKFLV
jgi:hypothetical protein